MKLHFSNRPFTGAAISTLAASALRNNAKSLGNTADQTLGSGDASGTEAQVAGASADSSSQSVTSILSLAAQDALKAQAKQLNDIRNAMAKLHAMPSANVLAKSMATERAAMLKKILDMLKQMMIGATPAQAKAMAAQLKDIAKELASMGKLLSDGGGASTSTTTSEPVATGEADAGGADSAGSAPATAVESGASAATAPVGAGVAAMAAPAVASASASPSGTPSQSAIGADAEGEIAAASAITAPASAFHNAHQAVAAYATETMRSAQGVGKNADEKAVDDGLRSALQEALKALRSLIAMLKSKLGASNKDVNEAESKMKELARSLAESGNQNDSATGVQELIQAQIAQDSGTAEAAVVTVTDSSDTAGGTGAEVSVGDMGGAVGGNISVSA